MTYFVNLLQTSYGQAGRYYSYRLYSGESVDDIKMNILNGIKDEWGDYIDGFERNLDIISGKPLNLELLAGGIEDYEDASFYFYGDYAIKIQDVFPILSDIRDEYNVSIPTGYAEKMSRYLFD